MSYVYCVVRKFGYRRPITKNDGTTPGTLSQTLGPVWQVDGKSISKTSTVELVDDIYDGQFVVAV